MARTVGSAAEDTRARILATAAELFVERGYAGTSVRDISQRLGMTKGSLYYHFTAKEDVLVALLEPLFEAVDAFVDATQAVVDGEVRVALRPSVAVVTGRRSERALYAETLASYAQGETFPHEAAAGFVQVAGLETELAAARRRVAVGSRPPE